MVLALVAYIRTMNWWHMYIFPYFYISIHFTIRSMSRVCNGYVCMYVCMYAWMDMWMEATHLAKAKSLVLQGTTRKFLEMSWGPNFLLPDPHTTKMKSARSHGPTGYLSLRRFLKKKIQVEMSVLKFPKWSDWPGTNLCLLRHQCKWTVMQGFFR